MRFLIACAALAAAIVVPAHATEFRSPTRDAPRVVALPAPLEKSAGPTVDSSGRLRVAAVRALAKAAAVPQWQATPDGWVTRFTASSSGAEGLRVRLDLAEVPGVMEARVQGTDGRIEGTLIDPRTGPESWTPWTAGDTQVIEVFSAVAPSDGAVRIGAVAHFDAAPTTKAAGTCTIPVACGTGDTTLDGAMALARKSVMKIQFFEGSSGYVCSATLIDTPQRPAPYVMTANHCVNAPNVAQTITSFWFFENSTCDVTSAVAPGRVQVNGGMTLVLGNHEADSTLLVMDGSPPNGALFALTNSALLREGQSMLSLSHPGGDTMRLAQGTLDQQFRLSERTLPFWAVKYSRGVIEGGSSGSGLFTLVNGSLRFSGTLLGSTINNSAEGMTCADQNEEAIYSRFDLFAPEIAGYIGAANAGDDAPNRPVDLFGSPGVPLSSVAYARDGLKIDYSGDLDTFKFTLAAPSVVSAWSEGANLDDVGAILDANGSWLASNDDAQIGSNHFGVSKQLDAGTYYVQVGHWEAGGTGGYNLRVRADAVDATNYSDLWFNAAESGWGLNINHQGNLIFASLYTYDANGKPLWLAMSNGARQADGSYAGDLARYTGAPFNAPWNAAAPHIVGSMRITFTSSTTAQLQYTLDGTPVTKSITRFVFAKPVTCKWSAFDRSYADNYQDLWYDPAEPGWGLNLAHQSTTMFAALFTYDANGNALWLVMSAGKQTTAGKFTGELYRTSGPPFNASPWVNAVSTQVGTMTLDFTDPDPNVALRGNKGTLTYTVDGVSVTKPIQRFEFGPVKPDCSSE